MHIEQHLFFYKLCERGHLIYSYNSRVENDFCKICGAKYYSVCTNCGTALNDHWHTSVYFTNSKPTGFPNKPGACGKCGHVFPWKIAEQRERENDAPADTAAALEIVRRLCLRFHDFIRQLRERHSGRPTLDISDEYDVQDALHALLTIHFKDIRTEEWTPSYAGGAARSDFLLKGYNIVIETKKTRTGLTDRKLGSELIEDHARYGAMQDCEHLVCFVYDPEERIRNVAGLCKDLQSRPAPPMTELIVVPRVFR